MLILTLRTDNPEAEIGLYDNQQQLAYVTWQAHRELAETIHLKISELFQANGKNLSDLDGVVAYEGPGSFTGLRIGMSTANALAYGLSVPISGASGDDWYRVGIQNLLTGDSLNVVLPEYGALPNITPQKK